MSIKIASRKQKARKLQDWVCEKISKILGIPYGHEDDCLIEGRLMGQPGVDVILRGQAFINIPFSFESKSTEKWDVPGMIRQAKKNQKENTFWAVIMKRKREKPVAIIDANLLFSMIFILYNTSFSDYSSLNRHIGFLNETSKNNKQEN